MAQLNQVANRVAHAILDQCGVSDKPVAFVSRCDVSTIAGILGILKAGKICVPLDLTLPRSRVGFVLEDSEAEIIVTGNEDLPTETELPLKSVKLISVDHLDPALPVENVDVNIRPEAVAWILYTSGSTGQPKGILQTHRDELHNVMTLTNSQYFSAGRPNDSPAQSECWRCNQKPAVGLVERHISIPVGHQTRRNCGLSKLASSRGDYGLPFGGIRFQKFRKDSC